MTGPGVLAVAARETRWIVRDKVALLLVVVVPLVAFALLSAIFGAAVIRDLRVAVVDADRSQTSMTYVQAIDAAPGAMVASRPSDLSEAMHAVRSGEAIAAVYLPRDLEKDMLAGKRPQVTIFYNKQYFTPGNVAANALQAAVSAATAALRPPGAARAYAPGALVAEQYVLSNPALNYVQFLLRAILPTVLHVVMAIASGYATGSEFSSRGVGSWMEAAGGSPLAALVGKLAPYFAIFVTELALGMWIIHGHFEIPFRGDPWMMTGAAMLLVLAYLSVGALLPLLVRDLPLGLTLIGVCCSPAFGYAGVGFPTLAMNGFAQGWGSALPLRWYMQILFDQAARGVPVTASAKPFAILGGLAVLYFTLAFARLAAVRGKPAKAAPPAGDERSAARLTLAGAFAAEYGRVLKDKGVFGLIVIGPLIYAAFYPQPYLGELIRDIPVAIVDDDASELSRDIAQAIDADEATRVAARPSTLAEAQAMLGRREIFGVVSIPAGTQRDVLKGEKARLPVFADSAYFLLYNRTLQGLSEGVAAVNAAIAARGARPDGSLYRAALTRSSPVETLSQPLFNPTGGYGAYVVPAALVLILQQTLLMGSATLGGLTFQRQGSRGGRMRGSIAAVLGQGLAHLALAAPGAVLYLIVLPRLYGFSALGRPLELALVAVPFLLAVSFLGQFVGSFFRRRETAVVLLIAISLPLFFLVGVAWPLEAIPDALKSLRVVFPSTFAIDGLVRVDQTGASLHDVRSDWSALWALAAIYAALAVIANRLTAWRSSHAR